MYKTPLPKPSFSNHPLNWAFLFLIFIASFSAASKSFAFEDDGSYSKGYYYYPNGINPYLRAPTKQGVADLLSGYRADYYGCTANSGLSVTCNQDRGNYPDTQFTVNLIRNSCSASVADHWYCSQEPTPQEPQNCQELADAHSSPESFELPSYSAYGCHKGCSMRDVGGYVEGYQSGQPYTSNYEYTGEVCPNSTYDPNAGIDVYQHDDDLQNCYDSTGRLIGRIGKNLSCPQLDICYNPDGSVAGTTSQSTSCSTGSKYNELDQTAQQNAGGTPDSATTVTESPDGSSTTVNETTETQTGLDGSSSTTSATTTTVTDSQGNVVSEETQTSQTNEQQNICLINPNAPECSQYDEENASASLSGNCDIPPTCSGDPVGCASVELQWQQVCAAEIQEVTKQDLADYKSGEGKGDFGVDVDSNGQLAALDRGEFNIADSLNLDQLGDKGSAGSCPSPHDLGLLGSLIQFKYDSICDFASSVRPLVIFSSIFLCMVMVRRSIVGV